MKIGFLFHLNERVCAIEHCVLPGKQFQTCYVKNAIVHNLKNYVSCPLNPSKFKKLI